MCRSCYSQSRDGDLGERGCQWVAALHGERASSDEIDPSPYHIVPRAHSLLYPCNCHDTQQYTSIQGRQTYVIQVHNDSERDIPTQKVQRSPVAMMYGKARLGDRRYTASDSKSTVSAMAVCLPPPSLTIPCLHSFGHNRDAAGPQVREIDMRHDLSGRTIHALSVILALHSVFFRDIMSVGIK